MTDTVSGGGTLPDSTPISDLLSGTNENLLTSNANTLTKGDLLQLRLGQGYKVDMSSKLNDLSVEDVNSITTAFDHQYGTSPDTAGASYKGGELSTTACCCCSTAPCCCCTAAAQADPFTE